MDKLDCVVVGAGVVGLAVARGLALAGREVVVLESEAQIGMHTSSRNSEVIHAGIYYPEGSLKARLCVQGKWMLYEYCEQHRVSHKRIGKLIVASDGDDVEKLSAIERQARLNGVDDLRFLAVEEVADLEPAVVSQGALLSPSTGIVDTHELMTAFEGEIEAAGGAVLLNSKVTNLSAADGALRFEVGGEKFECKTLVNSAGLWATDLIAKSRLKPLPQEPLPQEPLPQKPLPQEPLPQEPLPQKPLPQKPLPREVTPATRYAKGHYYAYPGKSPFRHLVYPMPVETELGIHATNDLGGAVRFGPDASWVDTIDYDFDESRKDEFVAAIKRYFPDLDADKLTPAYTGIRPKLHDPGEPTTDFLIQSEKDHGIPGLVNLFGIESPGLTACLAIGEYVRKSLSGRGF
jgi:L-2-hydroxyglutarate oxidase LhgO